MSKKLTKREALRKRLALVRKAQLKHQNAQPVIKNVDRDAILTDFAKKQARGKTEKASEAQK